MIKAKAFYDEKDHIWGCRTVHTAANACGWGMTKGEALKDLNKRLYPLNPILPEEVEEEE